MLALRLSLALLALVALDAPASAEDKAAARQAYAEGSRYYDLSQFAEALDAFKRAYWNYGRARHSVQHCPVPSGARSQKGSSIGRT